MSRAETLSFITDWNLHRLLRRNSISRAVQYLKIAFVVLSLLLTAILLAAIFEHLLATHNAISLVQSQNQVTPAPGADASNETTATRDYSVIAKRELFGTLGSQAPAQPVQQDEPVKKTTLNLALVGTFVETGGGGEAIIEDTKSKSQEVFTKGDVVFEGPELVAIYSDRVEIRRDGEIEVLALDDTPDASAGEGGVSGAGEEEFLVDEGELDQALDNLPLLLTQARAVPYFKDGKAIGLRLFAIKSGSLYEKVGLRNGDILKTINGNSLGDISQAMKLFEQLKEQRSITLSLERNKQEKTFRYQIR